MGWQLAKVDSLARLPRWCAAALFCAGLTCLAAPALADSTVHLKNGGFVRGDVMEVQPNVAVRVRMADGTVKQVAWAEIARIEEDAAQPPPAPPPARGGTQTAPAAPPSANAARINELRRERDDISDVGPAVMMIVGGLGFLIFAPAGLVMLAVGDSCDDLTADPDDCKDWSTLGAAFTIIGLGGGAAAIWGFVKALNNSSRKQEIDREILELKEQALLLDARVGRGGGELRLTLRF
jgi:hypothetical protein